MSNEAQYVHPDLFELEAPNGQRSNIFYIGVFGPNERFVEGTTDLAFLHKLHRLTELSWLKFHLGSLATCRLSDRSDTVSCRHTCSVSFCFLAGKTRVYAFTPLLAHRIVEHRYVPPTEFVRAIEDAPTDKALLREALARLAGSPLSAYLR